jgi:hypothetical protein
LLEQRTKKFSLVSVHRPQIKCCANANRKAAVNV